GGEKDGSAAAAVARYRNRRRGSFKVVASLRSARLRHEGPRGRDLGTKRIGIVGERNRGGIVLPRLGQIAGLLRRLRRAKRGAEAVLLLLRRRLVGGERILGHPAVEQHRAIKLARRRQRPRRDRRLLGLVLGVGRRAHGLERVVVLALGVEEPSARGLPLDID